MCVCVCVGGGCMGVCVCVCIGGGWGVCVCALVGGACVCVCWWGVGGCLMGGGVCVCVLVCVGCLFSTPSSLGLPDVTRRHCQNFSEYLPLNLYLHLTDRA